MFTEADVRLLIDIVEWYKPGGKWEPELMNLAERIAALLPPNAGRTELLYRCADCQLLRRYCNCIVGVEAEYGGTPLSEMTLLDHEARIDALIDDLIPAERFHDPDVDAARDALQEIIAEYAKARITTLEQENTRLRAALDGRSHLAKLGDIIEALDLGQCPKYRALPPAPYYCTKCDTVDGLEEQLKMNPTRKIMEKRRKDRTEDDHE
jgi:hypothetical protein